MFFGGGNNTEVYHLTNVIFLFAGNGVAANLPVLNSSQIPGGKKKMYIYNLYIVYVFVRSLGPVFFS